MGLTSTTIIREYIEKNVAEFDRTILEKEAVDIWNYNEHSDNVCAG